MSRLLLLPLPHIIESIVIFVGLVGWVQRTSRQRSAPKYYELMRTLNLQDVATSIETETAALTVRAFSTSLFPQPNPSGDYFLQYE